MLERVLVACEGNICRSPMAEALLRERLRNRPRACVESAGLAAPIGEPAHPNAQALLQDRGLDISRHRSRRITGELLARFDLVLVMSQEQKAELERLYPAARGRVHRIGRFGGFDVADPVNEGREAFAKALQLIERGIGDFDQAFWRHAS